MNLQGREISQGMQGQDILPFKVALALLELLAQGNTTEWDAFDAAMAAAVVSLQQANNLPATGIIDAQTARVINARLAGVSQGAVVGTILDANQQPAAGLLVRAFYPHIGRQDELLGEAGLDSRGNYVIFYQPSPNHQADLLVRLYNANNKEIAVSGIHCNVAPVQVIPFTLSQEQYRGPSEFERHIKVLTALLDNVTLSDLDDEALSRLDCKTDIPLEQLRQLRLDALYVEKHNARQGLFYGLMRQDFPRDYRRLLQEKPSRWRAALEASIQQNILPLYEPAEVDALVAQLQQLALESAFAEPPADEPPGLGNLISTSTLEEPLQLSLVSFALFYEGAPDDFWTELAQQQNISEVAVREAKFTLQSAALTFNHLPTLTAVQQLKKDRGWTSPRELAHLTRTDWQILLEEQGNIPVDYESAEAFAEAISRRVEATYPTAVVADRLLATDGLISDNLLTFFTGNPAFDLLHGSVDDFFADGAVLSGVSDPNALRVEVKMVQRLMRTVPEGHRGTAVPALLEAGYGSASAIAPTSRTDFLGTMAPKLGEELTIDIWEGARHRVDTTRMVALGVRDWLDSPRSPFMPHLVPDDERPAWAGMFGRTSYCSCEHCRSVYSPAAYMTDLLKYLRDAPWSGPMRLRGYYQLFLRRPDLQHILLNCENSNTILPYIDLVNELLEDAVLRVQEDGTLAPSDLPDPSHADYREAIARFQTSWEESHLRAQPEHEQPAATARLAGASFPWLLPFDPGMQRAWFFSDYLGLHLADLWELFGQSQAYLAMAHFHMTYEEWRVSSSASTDEAALASVWGVAELTDLEEVALFLEHSHLTYAEVQALLACTFFADAVGEPLVRMALVPGSDPCGLANLRLEGLTPLLLDLLHRFLRIQRKLNWSIPFFDRVLQMFGMSRETDAIMANAIYLAWRLNLLAKALRIPVEEVVQLYELPNEQRITQWSKAFRLSEVEFELLLDVLVENPYSSPLRCLQMLNKHNALQAAGFDLGELRYILRHEDQTPAAFAPHPDDLRQFLLDLHAFVRDSGAQRLEAARTEIEQAVVEFAESSGDDPPAVAEFREHYIQTLRQRFTAEAIVANVSQFLGLEPQLVESLIQPQPADGDDTPLPAALHAVDDDTLPAIADFAEFVSLSTSETVPDLAATATYDRARQLLIRLDKSARILRQLDISPHELEIMTRLRSENDFLDFNELPISAELPPRRPYDWVISLQKMIEAKQLQKELQRGAIDLFELMRYAATDGAYPADRLNIYETYEVLSERTGWSTVDLVRLRRAFRFSSEDFRNYNTYRRLREAHHLARRSRVSIDDLARWSTRTWSMSGETIIRTASELQEAARATHASDDAWYQTLIPLMDDLREKKRDALLAYLMHRTKNAEGDPLFPDAAAVYDHFLIDPEMSSCFLTSRIKQANASIQLFVQRVLMNLEEAKAVGSTDYAQNYWRQWEWMKNYRVWEANRKVFLYPENWIEPELRDNKSPFFEELENELLQGEVTDELVERVYRNYINKLDQVARLDVRALYIEESEHNDGIVHVFARTFSTPHVYFYRSRAIDQCWSPWQRIDLDIEGEHLIPVVHQGRLMLFWPTFKEQEVRGRRRWQLGFLWSEYDGTHWKSRRSSPSSESYGLIDAYPPDQLIFKTRQGTDESLEIDVFHMRTGERDRIAFSLATYRMDICKDELLFLDFRKQQEPKFRLSFIPRRMTVKNSRFVEIGSSFSRGGSEDNSFYYVGPISIDDTLVSPIDVEALSESTEGLGELLVLLIAAFVLADLLYDFERRFEHEAFPLIVLQNTPGTFTVIPPNQKQQFNTKLPFFYLDNKRAYIVQVSDQQWIPEEITPLGDTLSTASGARYFRFETFYHPYVCEMVAALCSGGLRLLLSPPAGAPLDRQLIGDDADDPVFAEYLPYDIRVMTPNPLERVEFSLKEAYGLYNRELFFHIPLFVAVRLTQNQRFEDAHRYFHYIFDPTDTSDYPAPARYWKVQPFFTSMLEPAETIEDLMRKLARGDAELEQQVQAWRNDPFNPHRIARMRIVAYMKTVVMKYLDNLIAWGDSLFQQDTMESINEATQLYMLAAELLGERPVVVEREDNAPQTFATLRDHLDDFANAMLEIESELPVGAGMPARPGAEPVPYLPFYFCLPPNEKLLAYWDTVADRLFKIRHCMNIEGQVRQLPLFEPPIDPALLIRARAAGLDLREALHEIAAPNMPHYRYVYTYQRAIALCNEVRSLGSMTLAAFEKRDAEALALLRSGHELSLLREIKQIKNQQVKEARETVSSLEAAKMLAEIRHKYFSSRKFLNSEEKTQLDLMVAANALQNASQMAEMAASTAHVFPDKYGGLVPGGMGGIPTPFGFIKLGGGSSEGPSLGAFARALGMYASLVQLGASMSGQLGSYRRRQDDWNLQAELAQRELEQIAKQIAAAEIRLAIAEQDQVSHDKQIEQSQEIEAFLRTKFTNRELYNWMTSQLSALHYQAYQMAYELAKKVERAARYELGLEPAEFGFIQFGQWESAKKGLLAGERLNQQLQRLDVAFHEHNRRELELTKHISLAMLDPVALIQLRETGQCFVDLPEVLFDLDYPGHYMRRLKSVSLTIPCVTGPYIGVHCTLTLHKHAIRYEPTLAVAPEERFGAVQSIATSSAQNDGGVFELNFRDERYLPFEGAGVISTWYLELPMGFRQFDYDTISDVIFHLNYTARDGGSAFGSAVNEGIQAALNTMVHKLAESGTGLLQGFSVRRDFPNEWHRLLHPAGDSDPQSVTLALVKSRFPFPFQNRDITINISGITICVKIQADYTDTYSKDTLKLSLEAGATASLTELSEISEWNGLLKAEETSAGSPGDWTLAIWYVPTGSSVAERVEVEAVEDIFLVCHYSI